MNDPTAEALFQTLMSKMDRLNIVWDNHHKGKSLTHFDGFSGIYGISSKVIGEAIEVLKLLHGKEPHEDLTDKINSIASDLSEMENCFREYLRHTPDDIAFIAYYMDEFFREYTKGNPLTVEDLTQRIDFMETAPVFKPFFLNE